jgi:serine/threonine protein kinase
MYVKIGTRSIIALVRRGRICMRAQVECCIQTSRQKLRADTVCKTTKHRDIKCQNCLLTVGGIVKLADFGASKNLREDKKASIAGTVLFLAPEVIQGRRIGRQVGVLCA